MVIQINNKVESFDYRGNEAVADNVLVEVEQLDDTQRVALHKELQRIKQESKAEKTANSIEQFDSIILPILKQFASSTCSLLEVERDDIGIITACFHSTRVLEITPDYKCLYLALLMAAQICVDEEQGQVVLALTYDCRKFIF